MPMGLAQKLQLTTSKYLVLFNSFLHNAKSKTSGINNFNSSSENSEEPDKNKSKWSDYLDKEMKQKFELAKNFMKTNKNYTAINAELYYIFSKRIIVYTIQIVNLS